MWLDLFDSIGNLLDFKNTFYRSCRVSFTGESRIRTWGVKVYGFNVVGLSYFWILIGDFFNSYSGNLWFLINVYGSVQVMNSFIFIIFLCGTFLKMMSSLWACGRISRSCLAFFLWWLMMWDMVL